MKIHPLTFPDQSDNLKISVSGTVSLGVKGLPVKVVICGSPQWTYDDTVRNEIIRLRRESRLEGKKLLIIHGGEPGPETVAHEYCKKNGIDTIVQAAVKVLGQNSYFRRNELILNYHKPDLVIGFAYSFKESQIVTDMLMRAREKGIEVKAIDYQSITRRDTDGIPIGAYKCGLI